MNDQMTPSPEPPSQREATATFARIGLFSFGGPAAQIALMHKYLVEEKGWLSERQFLDALSFCMLLPGPEAMQLATYAGWRLHGLVGGLIAGLLFVLPGAVIMLGLGLIYGYLGDVPLVAILFLGIKACVLVIVLEALLRISKRALKDLTAWIVAGLAFVAIFLLALPFPLIVLAAGLYGFARTTTATITSGPPPIRVSVRQTMSTIAIWLSLWWLPILVLNQLSGSPILADIGAFFAKLAVVTFGGAYAVLAYMAQDVVGQFGWLNPGEMMDGLGLAETTPGPLILVTQFVGFLAAFREGGVGLGLAGALVSLWVTFVPCFLWIFAGAPYLEWVTAQPRLNAALAAITAAVVGVILNLSIWFGLHVLFTSVDMITLGPIHFWQPTLASIDWVVAILAVISGFLLLKWHWSIPKVLGLTATLSLGLSLLT